MLKLERRYKVCRVLQWVCFALSIASATLPGTITAFRVAPSVKGVGPALGLAGYAIFIVAVSILIVMHSLGKTFAYKLPWALIAAGASWIMALVLLFLRDIIDQAVIISVAFALGCTVALVLSTSSLMFKAIAEFTEKEFYRKKDE